MTNPHRILYVDQGVTKRGLADYYLQVSEWILPHLVNRPLSLVRCPEGQHRKCFYQKHAGPGTSRALRRVAIREKEKTEDYLVVDNLAGLLALVQMGVLEIHAWGAQADHLERPDRVVFDLDPDPEIVWERVLEAARRMRDFLTHLALQSYVKTTGGKGLHVVVPIQRRSTWADVKEFSKSVVEILAREDPEQYTTNLSKAARQGKIFIDYLRNDRGATAVVPYSTRARVGAPVSVPLAWEELSPDIRSDTFNIHNLDQRLASLERDPWADISKVRQSLNAEMRKQLRQDAGKGREA